MNPTGVDRTINNVMHSGSKSPRLAGQKLEVNGVELYYVQKGNGPNVILCIPGAVGPSEWAFASQLEHFGQEDSEYTIVTFDLRGYGYSCTYDRQFTLEQDGQHHCKTDAIDAYALMEKLGHSQFSVLGWCDGGIVGIFLAALYPSAVTHLVVWGSRTFITKRDILINEEFEEIEKWQMLSFFQTWFLPVYGDVSKFISFYKQFTASLNRFLAVSENSELCTKEMSDVKCPTLILHGEKDRFTLLSHAERIKECIKGSELQIIESGRHMLQLVGEKNNELNERVGQFLGLR